MLDMTEKDLASKAVFLGCLIICLGGALFAWTSKSTGTDKHRQATHKPERRCPVTITDAIRMTRLGDLGDTWVPDHVAQFSPDRSKFVVILRKGNLEQNANEYSLLLWKTAEMSRSPTPVVLLTMSSSSNREAIKDVTWLSDNETIVFLGEYPGAVRQLYSVSVETRILKNVTNSNTDVLSYSTTACGDKIAYTTEEPLTSIFDKKRRRDGFVVSTEWLPELLLGHRGGPVFGKERLFFKKEGFKNRFMQLSEELYGETPILSPDGKYIAIAAKVLDVPEIWQEYSDPIVHSLATQHLPPGQQSTLQRYLLIDTRTRESRILLNSPLPSHSSEELFWSPKSDSVAISSVYLPLNGIEGHEREVRRAKLFVIEVNIETREASTVTDRDLQLVGWDDKTNRLVFETRRQNTEREARTQIFFRRNGTNWVQDQHTPAGAVVPQIVLVQDMNTPPQIDAVDPGTHRSTLLLNLNPQFTALKFAKVEGIAWKGSDGQDEKGGLYYPVDYVPGKRYPLVIQTHGWEPHAFWIDGPFSTAFAAQPLAGRNMVVLQMDERYADMLTSNELPREMGALEGAIDYLDTIGLIDRNRVGIIGFSRTCMHVKYALTHSMYHFAAASLTDGLDAGYLQYMLYYNASASVADSSEAVIGGPPFGGNLKKWMATSPGFNMDEVHTPVRIVAPNAGALLGEWEWFAGLLRLRRPVELIYMQDGEHILQKPWDRIVSQQGNVDWFCFWLKGEEDPDPAKAEQYKRWRELRKLQQGQTAGQKPN